MKKVQTGGDASCERSAFRRFRRFADDDVGADADGGGGGGGVLSSVPSLNDDELEQFDVAGDAR